MNWFLAILTHKKVLTQEEAEFIYKELRQLVMHDDLKSAQDTIRTVFTKMEKHFEKKDLQE